MTALLAGAVVATFADVAAFALLIVPGRAVESNPIVATMTPQAAVVARCVLLVALASLAVVAEALSSRLLRLTVSAALVIAIAVGLVGTASTLASI